MSRGIMPSASDSVPGSSLSTGANASPTAIPNPLAVILSSSTRNSVEPGTTFTISVTVSNRSAQSVIAQVFLDKLPTLLRQGCPVSQESLALAPEQSGEVLFPIAIPLDALPANYAYAVVVDAPDQDYPPRLYPQQLQILPSSQEVSSENDPTFVVQPATTVAHPAMIQRGESLPIQVMVYNRSDRVDRFRLRCPDLPQSWYSLDYPRDEEGVGLVLVSDSLRLNPGDYGQILLTLHPPFETKAGRFDPTIQLVSENDPELGLLDVIYVQLQPIYTLQPVFQTVVGRVGSQVGRFEIWLDNEGNTDRDIEVEANDSEEGDLCTCTLSPNPVQVLPQTRSQVRLQVKPNKWWRRPWFGGGKVINLRVVLRDRHQHPLPTNVLQGVLMWSPRPWWQVWPLIILALGVAGLGAYALWWWLFKPPVLPSIVEFFAEDSQYAAADGDTVRVGWTIADPRRIRDLRLVGRSPDGVVISGPLDYEFTPNEVPIGLQPFCLLAVDQLQCRNVQTDARQPGTYTFELTLTPDSRRRVPPPSSTSDPVVIDPIPQPVVSQFGAVDLVYQESLLPNPLVVNDASESDPPANEIALQWLVEYPENLRMLTLEGRTVDGISVGQVGYNFIGSSGASIEIPPALRPYCEFTTILQCIGVPTGIQQAGDYTFALTAVPIAVAAEPAPPVVTDIVKIMPLPPAIAQFQVNGENAQPKYLVPVDQGQPAPVVELAWDVLGGSGTVAELLPSPGTVPLAGTVAIPLGQQPGSTVLSLTVSNSVGKTVTRSVTFEVFDPTPTDPVEAAAAAIAAAQATDNDTDNGTNNATENPAGTVTSPSDIGTPSPSLPGQLSPTEVPPQFD
ncbi:MAG: hypothetical protein AB4042_00975 [Leptolyngbyaceae cyanobacterium]